LGLIWPVGVQVVETSLSFMMYWYKCWRCLIWGQ